MNLKQAKQLVPGEFVHTINREGEPENYRIKSITKTDEMVRLKIKLGWNRITIVDNYFLHQWGVGHLSLSSDLK